MNQRTKYAMKLLFLFSLCGTDEVSVNNDKSRNKNMPQSLLSESVFEMQKGESLSFFTFSIHCGCQVNPPCTAGSWALLVSK